MTAPLDILGRQSSHYTRMLRLLAHELAVPYALCPIHDLMSEDPAVYGGNPALKLPAVREGETVIWGSLNGCRAVAARAPNGIARVHWPEQAADALGMNAHEILAHAMAAQVEVVFHEIVSKRPPDAASRKRRASLIGCLAWLETHWDAIRATLPAEKIAIFDLGLFALLEHLPFRNPLLLDATAIDAMPRLVAFVGDFGARPSALATPYRFDAPPPEAAHER